MLRGLIISQSASGDTYAYNHRITKLTECLIERSFHCDLFYMKDHVLLYKQTTASLFMPLWLPMMRTYDFIYTGCEGAGHAVFFCRPFINAPIIYDVHGDIPAQSALARQIESNGRITTPSLRVRIVSAMAMACADEIVTVCVPHTQAYIKEEIPPGRLSMIRNGVDLDLFRQLPFPEKPEFTFGYAGAFQNWQGMELLVPALERLQDPSIRVLMVGFERGDEALKRTFSEKFGDRVKLVDKVDRKGLVELLRSVGILIIPRIDHPAIRHAFPTKFAEYAALGRPIMVNAVDETADFVTAHDCGFVSDPTPESMAETMAQAATIPSGELAEMGERGRKMAEDNFSWKIIGDEYASMVTSVVERYRKGKEP